MLPRQAPNPSGITLDPRLVREKLREQAMTGYELALRVGVAETDLNAWLAGTPPPATQMMRMAGLLGVSLAELAGARAPAGASAPVPEAGPVVADLDDPWVDALDYLTEFLPVNPSFAPFALRAQPLDYAYVQRSAQALRGLVGEHAVSGLPTEALGRLLRKAEVVALPMFEPEAGESATRLALPDSSTVWTRVNLRMSVEWFRHLLAHEVCFAMCRAHFSSAVAERFVSELANALLFPESAARTAYRKADSADSPGRVAVLFISASRYGVHPRVVAAEVQAYARARGAAVLSFTSEEVDEAAVRLGLVSAQDKLYGGAYPEPAKLVAASSEWLGSAVFDALRLLLGQAPQTRASFLRRALGYPQAYCDELLAFLKAPPSGD